MIRPLAIVLTSAIVGAALAGPAATAHADAEECVSYAMSEADAGILLADLACAAVTFLDCYRIFRIEYGPQLWAITACELR
ncbi:MULTISPECIES: hypothetical protein [unclassified Crossiella]|uniref:hypothetical protein n=1 Tax=unclassified Crossiella TaxID=2620835 RepID=UPI001FFEB507|nr:MULTISPECIES: hypothetical protein [unclassified Crossiella]MCK2244885.1 hypothetical protein [Crossiella sp. S99.2]MCK2258562.1 hypothetical protein [Crossiella sp. S99.1]